MFILFAFCSAMFLGLYDVAKKKSVTDNAVLPVLFLSVLFSTLIFSPFLLDSQFGLGWFKGENMAAEPLGLKEHGLVFFKSLIVLTSWICGYFSIKHLPLTITSNISATRPMMVLVGAIAIYGEKLNAWQWGGVLLSIVSLYLLSRVSRKEGYGFKSNKWFFMAVLAAVAGAASGLFDKYVMTQIESPTQLLAWNNLYQTGTMGLMLLLLWMPKRATTTPFRWSWYIVAISVMLSLADYFYFSALVEAGSMISLVSIVRRSSVVVSFFFGVLIFKERNVKAKLLDLLLIILGMVLIYLGTAY